MSNRLSWRLVLLAAGALGLGSCSGVLDALCTSGCDDPEVHSWVKEAAAQIGSSISGNTLINGVRTYRIEVTDLELLCVAAPESGNTVNFTIENISPDITAVGEVQPAEGYTPYRVNLTRLSSSFTLHGSITNIGLRQGSADGKHGYAEIRMFISLPAHTDESFDRNFLISVLTKLTVDWSFYHLNL